MKLVKLLISLRAIVHTLVASLILQSRAKNIKVTSIRKLNINGSVTIGDDFFSGESLFISTNKFCHLNIGDKVMFGPDVMLLGGNHNYKYTEGHLKDCSEDDKNTKDILIGSGVWVGARVIILSGAKISEGAIIGAGAVVLHYVPPYVIATGTPAKKFQARFTKKELENLFTNIATKLSVKLVEEIYNEYDIEFRE